MRKASQNRGTCSPQRRLVVTFHPFEQKLADAWPVADWSRVGVVVAVSGGADSVALLRAVRAIVDDPARIAVAHFNHRLRGAVADADQRWVETLCQSLGLACHVGHADRAEARPDRGGVEEAAREERYRFLQATAQRLGARFVATAHTREDQAETILHHILRGTGLNGLAGIRRVRPLGPAVTLIRPMLAFSHAEVLEYLAAHNQSFRQDATNSDPRFTRNRIRNELLPELARDYAPNVADSLIRLGQVAADAQQVLERLADDLLERALEDQRSDQSGGQIIIDCRAVQGHERHLVREMFAELWRRHDWPLKSMGLGHWNLLADLALAQPVPATIARHVLPGAIHVTRQNDRLMLEAPRPGQPQ